MPISAAALEAVARASRESAFAGARIRATRIRDDRANRITVSREMFVGNDQRRSLDVIGRDHGRADVRAAEIDQGEIGFALA